MDGCPSAAGPSVSAANQAPETDLIAGGQQAVGLAVAFIGFPETPQALAVAKPRGPVVIDLAGPYALEIPQQVVELHIGKRPGDRGQLRRLKTRGTNGLLQLGQGEEAVDVGVPVDGAPGLAQLPKRPMSSVRLPLATCGSEMPLALS